MVPNPLRTASVLANRRDLNRPASQRMNREHLTWLNNKSDYTTVSLNNKKDNRQTQRTPDDCFTKSGQNSKLYETRENSMVCYGSFHLSINDSAQVYFFPFEFTYS